VIFLWESGSKLMANNGSILLAIDNKLFGEFLGQFQEEIVALKKGNTDD
jgi:hypothetical protein